ncbi:hypothetical protein MLD38_013037 [Melastoma candidum]|uniref:Uncharacterized protein n=1 Tax=Melastoma candidum TaxID=119954 RepID=A0ACB9R898_9MYRT|nr:hypothetical protein MLD38_013037 [Melastoma candidum]
MPAKGATGVLTMMMPYLLMVALQFGLAGTYTLAMRALEHGMSRYVFVVYRNAIAALALAPFALFLEREIRPKMTPSVFLQIAFLGLLEPVIGLHFTYLGMTYTNASFGSAITNAVPSITFMMAVILRLEPLKLKELPGMAKVAGTGFTFAGTLVMTLYKGPVIHLPWSKVTSQAWPNDDATDKHWIVGATFMFVACVAWSAFYVLQSITVIAYPAEISLASLICLAGAIEGAVMALVGEHRHGAWDIGWDSRLVAPLYTGIVGSGITYYLQLLMSKSRGPVFVTAFNPLNMIVLAVLGSLTQSERLHLGSVIGSVVVVVGLYTVLWGKNKDYSEAIAMREEGREAPKPSAAAGDQAQ